MSVIERKEKSEWHVALAEDNDDHAPLGEMALERAVDAPVEIRRARNGEEAVGLIKGDDRLRSIPVAVLTSSDRDEDVAKSYGLGGNHFITKPERPAELEKKLSALLRNLTELGGIRRGSTGASTTAVSAVDPEAVLTPTVVRWLVFVGVLAALYLFGRFSGVF